VLGSPIRTSPDHSSVANSPGLIAGSYVLHRLLMPRHPPCALHSLSHKHSTKTTKIKLTRKTTKTRQSNNPAHHKGERLNRLLACSFTTSPGVEMPQDARVHYPIHKIHAHQETPGSEDPRPPRRHPVRRRAREICLTADASGLNSVSKTPPHVRPARFHTHPRSEEPELQPRLPGSTEADPPCRSVVHRRFH
jgi:hypothetical protein